jgi:acylphosphatase
VRRSRGSCASTAAVERITQWARRGPSDAHVTAVDVEMAEGTFERFEKRPTS